MADHCVSMEKSHEAQRRKLDAWAARAPQTAPVRLVNGIDCTMHPSNPRASFPQLPPLQELSNELIPKIVDVPSPTRTAVVAYALGAVAAMVLRRLRASPTGARLAVLLASLAALAWWGRRRSRLVVNPLMNRMVDVSSDPGGECNVVCNVVFLTNSHAGTHADTARHFLPSDQAESFSDKQYTGEGHVLDVSRELRERDTGKAPRFPITREVLQKAFQRTGLQPAGVWRLLLATRNRPDVAGQNPEQWQDEFAHFSPDGAAYLTEVAPRLLLVGLDTPSVDHESAAPIACNSHGALWDARVAILENLDLCRLHTPLDAAGGALRGSVLTNFSPGQEFKDALGCTVTFFPQQCGDVL